MTKDRLHELIAHGESLAVEFKGEESRPLSDDELVEAIVSSAYPDSEACTHKCTWADSVEAHYPRKGRTWHLSAATYHRLVSPLPISASAALNPSSKSKMMLQYVEKHGRTTRRDAAELCKISLPQAYRLLQRLVEHGKLVQKGKKKGSVYERRS